MRQCKCGGVLREGRFLDGRTSLKCEGCARYEIFRPIGEAPPEVDSAQSGDLFNAPGDKGAVGKGCDA